MTTSPKAAADPAPPSVPPWRRPVLALLGMAVGVYATTLWIDLRLAAPPGGPADSAWHQLTTLDEAQAQHALGGLGEMMAAVLGLALTVSSIIVQLAATRFTPHVTTLFFRARTNVLTWGFFVGSTIFVIWVNASIGTGFVPRAGVLMALLALTASLTVLFPYFGYVFHFLDPDSIIGRIAYDGRKATRSRPQSRESVVARKQRFSAAVERLADIALNAIGQRDKHNASSAIAALCELHGHYAAHKPELADGWFRLDPAQRRNADFSNLSINAVDELEARRLWPEWKLLRQYQLCFGESLSKLDDLTHLIATDTRRIAEAAAHHDDAFALDLAIKFFNTYLRASINAGNARTAYNVLHQYRQLAESLLEAAEHDPQAGERAGRIAGFFGYYSQLASQRDLPFVVEVIAHDLATLCAAAHERGLASHATLLDTFLGIDDPNETRSRDHLLAGVRRAQVKLATTYLLRDDEEAARAIFRDMAREPAERLAGIRRQLLALESSEFWEINDRGTNFDYLTPAQKGQLERFFGWFGAAG